MTLGSYRIRLNKYYIEIMRRIAASALILGASLLSVSSTEYDETLGMKNYYYAAAAYCPNNIDQWQCGPPCRDGP